MTRSQRNGVLSVNVMRRKSHKVAEAVFAVLEQIRLAPANYNGARPANNPTPEQEAELKSYRAKEKELSRAIANFS